METNTELLNRIEAHIKGRLAVAESRAASSELYEGKKIAYTSMLGFVNSLRTECAAQARLTPSDVQEAADKYIGHPYEVAEGVEVSMRRDAYAAGMLAERERLMAGAIKTDIFDIEDGSDAAKLIVSIPGAKTGDKVYIIKENK